MKYELILKARKAIKNSYKKGFITEEIYLKELKWIKTITKK